MKAIHHHLSATTRGRANGALHLMTAISTKSPELAKELLQHLDWQLSALRKLARPPKYKASEDGESAAGAESPLSMMGERTYFLGNTVIGRPTRPSFVLWVLTLLRSGDPTLVSLALSCPPLTSGLMHHIGGDPPGIFADIMATLESHVLAEGSRLTPAQKSTLFDVDSLVQLADICASQVPSDNTAAKARELGERILKRACTDPVLGVAPGLLRMASPVASVWGCSRDVGQQAGSGTAGAASSVLSSFFAKLRPSVVPYHAQVIRVACEASPALATAALRDLSNCPLEPRPNAQFHAATELFRDLMRMARAQGGISGDEASMSPRLTAAPSATELAELVRSGLPAQLTRAMVTRGLQHKDGRVRVATLEILNESLQNVSAVGGQIRAHLATDVPAWHECVREVLPDPQVLLYALSASGGRWVSESREALAAEERVIRRRIRQLAKISERMVDAGLTVHGEPGEGMGRASSDADEVDADTASGDHVIGMDEAQAKEALASVLDREAEIRGSELAMRAIGQHRMTCPSWWEGSGTSLSTLLPTSSAGGQDNGDGYYIDALKCDQGALLAMLRLLRCMLPSLDSLQAAALQECLGTTRPPTPHVAGTVYLSVATLSAGQLRVLAYVAAHFGKVSGPLGAAAREAMETVLLSTELMGPGGAVEATLWVQALAAVPDDDLSDVTSFVAEAIMNCGRRPHVAFEQARHCLQQAIKEAGHFRRVLDPGFGSMLRGLYAVSPLLVSALSDLGKVAQSERKLREVVDMLARFLGSVCEARVAVSGSRPFSARCIKSALSLASADAAHLSALELVESICDDRPEEATAWESLDGPAGLLALLGGRFFDMGPAEVDSLRSLRRGLESFEGKEVFGPLVNIVACWCRDHAGAGFFERAFMVGKANGSAPTGLLRFLARQEGEASSLIGDIAGTAMEACSHSHGNDRDAAIWMLREISHGGATCGPLVSVLEVLPRGSSEEGKLAVLNSLLEIPAPATRDAVHSILSAAFDDERHDVAAASVLVRLLRPEQASRPFAVEWLSQNAAAVVRQLVSSAPTSEQNEAVGIAIAATIRLFPALTADVFSSEFACSLSEAQKAGKPATRSLLASLLPAAYVLLTLAGHGTPEASSLAAAYAEPLMAYLTAKPSKSTTTGTPPVHLQAFASSCSPALISTMNGASSFSKVVDGLLSVDNLAKALQIDVTDAARVTEGDPSDAEMLSSSLRISLTHNEVGESAEVVEDIRCALLTVRGAMSRRKGGNIAGALERVEFALRLAFHVVTSRDSSDEALALFVSSAAALSGLMGSVASILRKHKEKMHAPIVQICGALFCGLRCISTASSYTVSICRNGASIKAALDVFSGLSKAALDGMFARKSFGALTTVLGLSEVFLCLCQVVKQFGKRDERKKSSDCTAFASVALDQAIRALAPEQCLSDFHTKSAGQNLISDISLGAVGLSESILHVVGQADAVLELSASLTGLESRQQTADAKTALRGNFLLYLESLLVVALGADKRSTALPGDLHAGTGLNGLLQMLLTVFGCTRSKQDFTIARILFKLDRVLTGCDWDTLPVAIAKAMGKGGDALSGEGGSGADRDDASSDSGLSNGADASDFDDGGDVVAMGDEDGDGSEYQIRQSEDARSSSAVLAKFLDASALATSSFLFGEAAQRALSAGCLSSDSHASRQPSVGSAPPGAQTVRAVASGPVIDTLRVSLSCIVIDLGDGPLTECSADPLWLLLMLRQLLCAGTEVRSSDFASAVLPVALRGLGSRDVLHRVLSHECLSRYAGALVGGHFREKPLVTQLLAFVSAGMARHGVGPARPIQAGVGVFLAHCATAMRVRGSSAARQLVKLLRRKREMNPESVALLLHLQSSGRVGAEGVVDRLHFLLLLAASAATEEEIGAVPGFEDGGRTARLLRRHYAFEALCTLHAHPGQPFAVRAAACCVAGTLFRVPGYGKDLITRLGGLSWAADALRDLLAGPPGGDRGEREAALCAAAALVDGLAGAAGRLGRLTREVAKGVLGEAAAVVGAAPGDGPLAPPLARLLRALAAVQQQQAQDGDDGAVTVATAPGGLLGPAGALAARLVSEAPAGGEWRRGRAGSGEALALAALLGALGASAPGRLEGAGPALAALAALAGRSGDPRVARGALLGMGVLACKGVGAGAEMGREWVAVALGLRGWLRAGGVGDAREQDAGADAALMCVVARAGGSGTDEWEGVVAREAWGACSDPLGGLSASLAT